MKNKKGFTKSNPYLFRYDHGPSAFQAPSLRSKGRKVRGFTLVELIVVIGILAILGTVWFIMLWSYNKDARDSKRLADLDNLEKIMDLYFINNWNYPDPSWYSLVTYSWAEVWKQWTIWDDTIGILWNINVKPVDPLTQTEYSYSLLNTWDKYELWALLEWNLVYSSILPNAHAAVTKEWFSLVKWNFNKAIVEVSTWGLTYALAVPTIIASDLSNSDLMNIIWKKGLAYNWYSNIPASYSKKGYKTKWWFDFNWTKPNNVLLFEWNTSDLNKWWVILKTFSDKLKAAYSWTTISNEWIYKQILAVDTNNTSQISNVISPIINKALSWKVALSTSSSSFTTNVTTVTTAPPNTCAPTPTFTNIWTTTPWTPTSPWQSWSYNATPWNCTYTCTGWYTWNNCITSPPSPTTVASCSTTSWQIVYWSVDWLSGSLTCSDDIIICNWTTWSWYIISACNAWANTVYANQTFPWSSSSRTSLINAWAWWLYQWWNNADLSLTWSTTSIISASSVSTGSTYNNPNSFIQTWTKTGAGWVLPIVDDLWWYITNTLTSQIWPCSTWYHVPSDTELNGVISIFWSNWSLMWSQLMLPMGGNRHSSSSSFYQQWIKWYYWTITPNTNDTTKTNYLRFNTSSITISSWPYYSRANAMAIRCFKN